MFQLFSVSFDAALFSSYPACTGAAGRVSGAQTGRAEINNGQRRNRSRGGMQIPKYTPVYLPFRLSSPYFWCENLNREAFSLKELFLEHSREQRQFSRRKFRCFFVDDCVLSLWEKLHHILTVVLACSDFTNGYLRGGGLSTCKNTHVRRTEKKVWPI